MMPSRDPNCGLRIQEGGPWALMIEGNPFRAIFRDGLVPIKSAAPTQGVRLEKHAETVCYFLDWRRCSLQDQLNVTAAFVSTTGKTREKFVAYMIDGGAIPIRDSQVEAVLDGFFEVI
jgi:hypothetical protein